MKRATLIEATKIIMIVAGSFLVAHLIGARLNALEKSSAEKIEQMAKDQKEFVIKQDRFYNK